MDDNKIVLVATGVMEKYDIYVVKGKAIAIYDNALDLSLDDDVKEILRFADNLYVNKFLQPCYGDDTICVLSPLDNGRYTISMSHLSDVSEDVQEKVRAAIFEYARNQIVDINGYFHVIHGRVICFKHDVYDLDNPEDVKNLLMFVDDLPESDNSVCIELYRNPKNPDEVIVGLGGNLHCIVRYLDADVRAKLMDAMHEFGC